jgi:hypothetical protein
MFIALLELRYGLFGMWAIGSVITILLCIPLTFVLCRDLALPAETRVCAAVWPITSAAFITYTPIASTAATAFLTLVMLLGMARALRGQWGYALLSGLALAGFALYSFTAVFAALLALLWLAAAFLIGVPSRVQVVRCALVFAVSSVGVWMLLYFMTGFDLALCLKNAVANNRDSMSHELFESSTRYLLRLSGNLLAYVAYLGPLAALYALYGTWRASRTASVVKAFAWATVATLVMAGFSGSFFLETERIWMFFTPGIAVVAGYGVCVAPQASQSPNRPQWVLVASLVLALSFALSMTQQIPPEERVYRAVWERARALLRPPVASHGRAHERTE